MTDLSKYQTEVRAYHAYDQRDTGGGRDGLRLEFILRGPLGAISAEVKTYWMPRGGTQSSVYALKAPMGRSISSHCPEPREDWWLGPQDCPILGVPCYGDTGYLVGDHFLEALVGGGHEAGWEYLAECYEEWLVASTAKAIQR